MDIFWVFVSWAVVLGGIYVAYAGVREVEQIARRPFSPLLTLLLTSIGAGLLVNMLDLFSGYLYNQTYPTYYNNHWLSIGVIAIVAGAGVLIRRDVLLRIQQGACPQCNTPMLGHAACPSCGWGSLRLPIGLSRLPMRPAPRPRVMAPAAPAESAPTVFALSANAAPPHAGPGAGQAAAPAGQFCIMCGAALAAGQTFCVTCGTPVSAPQ